MKRKTSTLTAVAAASWISVAGCKVSVVFSPSTEGGTAEDNRRDAGNRPFDVEVNDETLEPDNAGVLPSDDADSEDGQTLPVLPGHPLAYWKFDETSGIALDATGRNYPAKLTGTATRGTGAFGQALSLSGAAALGTAETSGTVLDTTKSFSVSAWVAFNNVSGDQTLVSQDGDLTSGFFLKKSKSGPLQISMSTMDSSDWNAIPHMTADSLSNPEANVWYHVVGIYEAPTGASATGEIRLFVNGVFQNRKSITVQWQATGSLVIGRGKWKTTSNPTGLTDWVDGRIDEVMVFDRALTDAEVSGVYTRSAAGAWNLESAAGNPRKTPDSSGFGNEGTLQTGATIPDAGGSDASSTSTTNGKVGNAVELDGTSTSYINFEKAILDTSQSYSVSVWVKPKNTNGWQTFVSQDNASIGAFFLQKIGDLNGLKAAMNVYYVDVEAANIRAISTTDLKAGTWYHLVGIYDKTAQTVMIYVNGVLEATSSLTQPVPTSTGPTAIGRAKYLGNYADFANATIDQVRAYQRVLTSDEIVALFNNVL